MCFRVFQSLKTGNLLPNLVFVAEIMSFMILPIFTQKITMKPHLPSHPRFNTSPCCWGASRILIKGVNHVNFDKEG